MTGPDRRTVQPDTHPDPRAWLALATTRLAGALRLDTSATFAAQRRPLRRVLSRITALPERDGVLQFAVDRAMDILADPSIDRPIAAWQAAMERRLSRLETPEGPLKRRKRGATAFSGPGQASDTQETT